VNYDKVIHNILGYIPVVKGNYNLKNNKFSLILEGEDLDIYKKLYFMSPPKKGKEEGYSKGSGNGELSLYWLFKYQQNSIPVFDARKGSMPDLLIGETYCEVKAYDTFNKKIPIGRFGNDKRNIKILNRIFGFYSFLFPLELDSIKHKEISSTNFNGVELYNAFKELFEFYYVSPRGSFGKTSFLYKIYHNLDLILKYLNSPSNPEQATRNLITNILIHKLKLKPGNKEYVCIASSFGQIDFYLIDFEKLYNIEFENLIHNFEIQQSFVYLNFNNVF
jgi:hypothetical protein